MFSKPNQVGLNKDDMSRYQDMIVTALQDGARLCSTEGRNYKCWLVYPDGKHQNIRRKSAEIVCEKHSKSLVFGENRGIRWRTNFN